MQNPWEAEVCSFRRKYNLTIFAHHLIESLWVGLILFGTSLLLVRLFVPGSTYWLYITGVLAGLVVVGHSLRSPRKFITTEEALAFVDYYSETQGALLTSWEKREGWHPGDWKARLRNQSYTPPRWRMGYFLGRILPPLLFFGAALLVPPRIIPLQAQDHGLEQREQELKRELEKLKEKKLLYESDAKALEETLKELQKKKQKGFSQSDWEALDRLQKEIARSMRKKDQDQKLLEKKAEALSKALKNKDLERVHQAYQDLKKTLERLNKKNKLKEMLSSELRKNPLSSKKDLQKLLDPKTSPKDKKKLLDKLSKKLSKRDLDRLKKMLSKMKDKKKLSQKDQRYLEKLAEKLSEQDLEALKRGLQKLQKKTAKLQKKEKKCPKCGEKMKGGT